MQWLMEWLLRPRDGGTQDGESHQTEKAGEARGKGSLNIRGVLPRSISSRTAGGGWWGTERSPAEGSPAALPCAQQWESAEGRPV